MTGTRLVEQTGPVGLGLALVVQTGEKAQFTLQTHVERDADDWEHARVVDRLYRAGRRMAAHYRIEDLQRILSSRRDNRAFSESQFARAENDFLAQTERRAKQVEQVMADDQASFDARGRHGEYAPTQSALKRVQALKEEQAKAEELRQRTIADHQVTMQKLQEDDEICQREIHELRALLDASDG